MPGCRDFAVVGQRLSAIGQCEKQPPDPSSCRAEHRLRPSRGRAGEQAPRSAISRLMVRLCDLLRVWRSAVVRFRGFPPRRTSLPLRAVVATSKRSFRTLRTRTSTPRPIRLERPEQGLPSRSATGPRTLQAESPWATGYGLRSTMPRRHRNRGVGKRGRHDA